MLSGSVIYSSLIMSPPICKSFFFRLLFSLWDYEIWAVSHVMENVGKNRQTVVIVTSYRFPQFPPLLSQH
jgi:hypothetical protein